MSDNPNRTDSRLDTVARILFPLLLAIPNFVLSVTEPYSAWGRIANVLLPLGIYYWLYWRVRRWAVLTLWLIPIMLFCAFQIVLLHLYGESIIAIDMFLNVATTNTSEATELLSQLAQAVVTVCVIYLPMIVLALWRLRRQSAVAPSRRTHLPGLLMASLGLTSMLLAYVFNPAYDADRQIFPLNVVTNLCQAFGRYHQSQVYPQTSADFDYKAISTHPDSIAEVYVVVVGETARADNWQLMGYNRPTNPRLSRVPGLVAFPNAYSQSNTTHKSVPMMLTHLDANNYGDSINVTRSVFQAFEQCGYATAFFSGQRRNHSYIDHFGNQAQQTVFIMDQADEIQLDEYLLPLLEEFLQRPEPKKFVVMHTYGSHFKYNERYSQPFGRFQPTAPLQAEPENRHQLINAYDNTILYTDHVLAEIISELQRQGVPAVMLYASDHGEDIFDDRRERFLHASPTATRWQLHVPMLVWMSPEYRAMYPAASQAVMANRLRLVSPSVSIFSTLIDMAGIRTPYWRANQSVAAPNFASPTPLFLNDYNEAEPATEVIGS